MSGGSSIYLPLPQSNTDSNSESEEELQSGCENHIVIRQLPRLENKNDKVNYKQLDDDRDLGTTLNGFSPTVTVVKPIISVPVFTTTRKILFTFSLLICVATIVGFLWILPCDLDPCPPVPAEGAKSWETPLSDLELHGPIAVVERPVGQGKNLIFLGRSSLKTSASPARHRLLCLFGSSGDMGWTQTLVREPIDLDCSVLDVNKDGVLDCLVAGGQDLLKAVDPLSGITLWELAPISKDLRPVRTQFPVRLPDIDGDDVPDLLTARSFFDRNAPSLLLVVSGATGKLIGKPVPTAFCAGIAGLTLEKYFSVSYSCIDVYSKISEQTISLGELLERSGLRQTVSWPSSEANDLPRTFDSGTGASHEVRVAGKRLLLENRGRCPSDCLVVVFVKDKENNTLYNFSMEAVYGMVPVTLSFGKITGFALKYWQWHGRKGKRTSNATADASNSSIPVSNLNPSSLRRARKRSVIEDDMWVEVSEQVVLITFNETDLHVVNVSLQSLVLLCRVPKACQPNAQSMQRSLLIADLDGDGSKELVSYTSSYVNTKAGEPLTKPEWHLQARVRVVRLEAELPQLYEALNHA